MTLSPWLAGAALVALSAQPALAQSEAVSPPAAPPSAGQTVHASEVIGARVVNQHGEAVGKLTDLVIDARRIEYAVVAVGGVLGLGRKDVAIPLDELRLGIGESYLLSGATEAELAQLPPYQRSR